MDRSSRRSEGDRDLVFFWYAILALPSLLALPIIFMYQIISRPATVLVTPRAGQDRLGSSLGRLLVVASGPLRGSAGTVRGFCPNLWCVVS